jgi:hypothetical protein
MANGSYLRTLKDYGGEKTTFKIRTAELSAANFDAQATLRAALATAIAGITTGVYTRIAYGNEETQEVANPSDPFCQREMKWVIHYRETGGGLYRCELGTADLDQLDPNDREHANIGDAGVVDAFVSAFEAYAKGPGGGAVTVVEIEFVGRNT